MIQSLQKAMDILLVLKGHNDTCSIAQLAETLKLPPSTIHRILQTLCAAKFVIKEPRSHNYQLGPALIPLGIAAQKNLRMHSLAHPILEELAKSTKEDAFLVIPVGYKGIVLDRIDGPSSLKIVESFGVELDMHCGAIRKALLAYQSDDFIDYYLKNILTAPHAFPKTSEKVLVSALKKIRAEGVAVSHGDYVNGTIGVGAPVFNASGKITASIGIVAPALRIPDEIRLSKIEKCVKTCAKELSNDLGYFEE